jgi:nucleoid-associated protein YgaU
MNVKDPYSNGLIISYNEGDFSLERIPPQLVDNQDDQLHIVRDEETLNSIAQQYYKEGKYWYLIADKNNLLDIFTLYTGQQLIIPHLNSI